MQNPNTANTKAQDQATAAETSQGASNSPKPQTPSACTVLFVRHGQTPSTGEILPGRDNSLPISEQGQKQAENAAELIAYQNTTSKPSAIYSSPMLRTRQTAQPIATALNLEIEIEHGLNECDFGDWTGLKLSELRQLPEWKTVQHYPSGFCFPNGESFRQMQYRMVETVRKLSEKHSGETIVVVSHADTIKAALADALGTHLDLFQRIAVSPCSVSTVTYMSVAAYVQGVNVCANPASANRVSARQQDG